MLYYFKKSKNTTEMQKKDQKLKRTNKSNRQSDKLLFKKILFIFRQRGKEGEREGEKHQCMVASPAPLTGDLAHNPGMCPDWESNQQPFGSQAGAQSTEPHQPGPP